jgi:GntR family transcriptional repressor for pyruvate dehydrogenase complex
MQIQAVKSQRLYLQVADQLVALIRSGRLVAGDRLPAERDLAERFGVSRPTIREAMIALEIAGLVDIRSGSGVYVLDQPFQAAPVAADQGPGPFEILEARRLFEGEACALAAERVTNEQIEQLKQLLRDMERENQQQDAHEEADRQFHCLIAEAAGNSAISATVSWLWRLRNESEISQRFHQRVREEGIKPIIEDHQRIVSALEDRDPARSRRAMAAHLQRVIDNLLETQ